MSNDTLRAALEKILNEAETTYDMLKIARAALAATAEPVEPVAEFELKAFDKEPWDVAWRGEIPAQFGATCYRNFKVGDKIKVYLSPQQTAEPRLRPHEKRLICQLEGAVAAKQAQIDALMLEYCSSEMTAEQMAEWERHQKPVAPAPADATQLDRMKAAGPWPRIRESETYKRLLADMKRSNDAMLAEIVKPAFISKDTFTGRIAARQACLHDWPIQQGEILPDDRCRRCMLTYTAFLMESE